LGRGDSLRPPQCAPVVGRRIESSFEPIASSLLRCGSPVRFEPISEGWGREKQKWAEFHNGMRGGVAAWHIANAAVKDKKIWGEKK